MKNCVSQYHSEKLKYLGIELTNELKDLYNENYSTVEKQIEEDIREWRDILCSLIGRTHIAKWPFY